MAENDERYEFNSLLADIAEVAAWLDSLGFDKNDRFLGDIAPALNA